MDPLHLLQETKIKELVEQMRPPVHIRNQLDIGYSYEKQNLEIYESRPRWNNKSEVDHHPFAKARFISSKNIWKIYWRRASGKWQIYEPHPEVNNIEGFFKVINEDKLGAFLG